MKKNFVYMSVLFIGIIGFVMFNIASTADKQIETGQTNIALCEENKEIKQEVVHLKTENTKLKTDINELQTQLADTIAPIEIPVAASAAPEPAESYELFSE